MDSDIDSEIPTKLKRSPNNSPFIKYAVKSPYPALPDENIQIRPVISPSSIYSTKSIKDNLDITKIRSVLNRLKTELEEEKAKNVVNQVTYEKELANNKEKWETQQKIYVKDLNHAWKRKLEKMEAQKLKEIEKLNEKIVQLTRFNRDNLVEETLRKIENILLTFDSIDKIKIKIIIDLLQLLKAQIKKIMEDADNNKSKADNLHPHNTDLTNLVKILKIKLNDANTHDKIGDTNQDQPAADTTNDNGEQQLPVDASSSTVLLSKNIENLLRISAVERMQLEKQIIWLKLKQCESGDANLTDQVDNLQSVSHNYKLHIEQMEQLLKSSDLTANKEDESTEALKDKVRELEKLCRQQQLNYEEALLELESMKKSHQRRNGSNEYESGSSSTYKMNSSLDQVAKQFKDSNQLNEDVMKVLQSADNSNARAYNSSIQDLSTSNTRSNNQSNFHSNSESAMTPSIMTQYSDIQLGGMLQQTPPPTNIRIESQKTCHVVRWNAPHIDANGMVQLTGYHVYLDGHIYKSVSINEPMAVALPKNDHKSAVKRVSVRSVSLQGQSKDAQCTINLSGANYAPSNVKASKITSTSAQISWMPCDSNLPHQIWLNNDKYCEVDSTQYKCIIQDLTPNTLQRVRIHPSFPDKPHSSDNPVNSGHVAFQTLPACSQMMNNIQNIQHIQDLEDLEPPTDVKLKLGSRPGKFIVKWTCPQNPNSSGSQHNLNIIGYSIMISGQCIALVNGAKNDRFSVNLSDLRHIIAPNYKPKNVSDQPHLALTVRTVGVYSSSNNALGGGLNNTDDNGDLTIHSRDSSPMLRFSGHVAARIAGTAAEAAMMLGDQLGAYLHLIEASSDTRMGIQSPNRDSRSSKHHHNADYPAQSKMSVPKIQITKDSSFSDNEDNYSRSSSSYHHRQQRINNLQQHQRSSHHQQQQHRHPDSSRHSNNNSNSSYGQNQQSQYNNDNNSANNNNNNNNRMNQPRVPNQSSMEYTRTDNQPIPMNSSSSTNQSGIRYFVTLYDYDPATMSPNPDAVHEELPFRAGQTIKIFGQLDEDGFYTGQINGRRGLVPSNMVTEFDNNAKFKPISANNTSRVNNSQHQQQSDDQSYYNNPPPPPTQPSNHRFMPPGSSVISNSNKTPPGCRRMIALYDYDPQTLSPNVDSEAELPFRSGDEILILGDLDEDGFYMGELQGHRGLVPSNFLTDFHNYQRQQQNRTSGLPSNDMQQALPMQHQMRSQGMSQPPTTGNNQQRLPPQQQYYSTQQSMSSQVQPTQQQHTSGVVTSSQVPTRDTRLRNQPPGIQQQQQQQTQAPHLPPPQHQQQQHIQSNYNQPQPQQIQQQPNRQQQHQQQPNNMNQEYNSQHPNNVQQHPQHPQHQQQSINNNNMALHIDQQRTNSSFEESFDSGGAGMLPRNDMSGGQGAGGGALMDNPLRQTSGRRPSSPRDIGSLRRHNPPVQEDDMPIVMDLSHQGSSSNQKKKKSSSNESNYRTSTANNNPNSLASAGLSDSLHDESQNHHFLNSNENLERKRSVFKNPFKKKKS